MEKTRQSSKMTSRRGEEPSEFPRKYLQLSLCFHYLMGQDRILKNVEFSAKKTDKGGMRNANALDVVMNAYRVKLDSSVKEVYKYELKFVVKYEEREKDITRGPKNE